MQPGVTCFNSLVQCRAAEVAHGIQLASKVEEHGNKPPAERIVNMHRPLQRCLTVSVSQVSTCAAAEQNHSALENVSVRKLICLGK